jgi:hypothetical protein
MVQTNTDTIRLNTTVDRAGITHHGLERRLEKLQEQDPTIKGLKQIGRNQEYWADGAEGYTSHWKPYR